MKKNKLFLTSIVLFTILTAFRLTDDIIARLGLEQKTARYFLLSNITGSFEQGPIDGAEEDGGSDDSYKQMKSFRIPYMRLLPSIVQGDKAGAARELCAYVKMYVNSTDFAEDYEKRREAAKPTSEPWRPDEDMIKSQRQSVKELEKQINDLKKQKSMSPELLKTYEKGLADQKKMLADWEDPHPNLTRWQKQYPEDPAVVVKNKLQEYLSLVATVDFNAPLTAPDKYKKIKFVNPAHEKQSLRWKACFRAGKEVNEIVTAFVKEWLKGEIISNNKVKMPEEKPAESVKASPATQPATPAPVAKADSVSKPVKEKKSLLNKLKKATGF